MSNKIKPVLKASNLKNNTITLINAASTSKASSQSKQQMITTHYPFSGPEKEKNSKATNISASTLLKLTSLMIWKMTTLKLHQAKSNLKRPSGTSTPSSSTRTQGGTKESELSNSNPSPSTTDYYILTRQRDAARNCSSAKE